MRRPALLPIIAVSIWACGTSGSEREQKPQSLPYSIVAKEDTSYGNVKRMVYRVMFDVAERPSDQAVKATSEEIHSKFGGNQDEFTVFSYLPEMDSQSFAYGVAEWKDGNLSHFLTNEGALYGTKWDKSEEKAAAADQAWKEQKEESDVSEYNIDLTLEPEAGRKLQILVKTNFPDGTRLLVSVGRDYFEKNNPETYSGEMFNEDIPVRDGKIERKVTIDDSQWVSAYSKKAKQLPDMFPGIDRASDEVEVRVLFSPKRKQSAEIYRILGTNGEKVKGSQATRLGNFTTLDVEERIKIPFKP